MRDFHQRKLYLYLARNMASTGARIANHYLGACMNLLPSGGS